MSREFDIGLLEIEEGFEECFLTSDSALMTDMTEYHFAFLPKQQKKKALSSLELIDESL